MKRVLLAGVAAVSLVLAGCKSDDTIEGVQNYTVCTYPDAPTIEAPSWICDVMPSDLALGAQGYAKKSAAGIAVMKKVAINNARAALAGTFETDVSDMFRQAVKSNVVSASDEVTEEVTEAFNNVTKTITSQSLTNSRVIVSQRSPGGGLFVLVGMDQATYDQNVARIVEAASAKDSEMRKKFANQKLEKNLLSALDSMTK